MVARFPPACSSSLVSAECKSSPMGYSVRTSSSEDGCFSRSVTFRFIDSEGFDIFEDILEVIVKVGF